MCKDDFSKMFKYRVCIIYLVQADKKYKVIAILIIGNLHIYFPEFFPNTAIR